MRKKKKDKKTFEQALEFNDVDSQHKAWVILGIYFLVFMIIVLSLKNNNTKLHKKQQKNKYLDYGIEMLKKENYHFKYTIDFDNNVTVYEGDKKATKEKFTKTRLDEVNEFYSQNNVYLINKDNNWERVESPYEIITFRTYQDLSNILNKATYISKTEYGNGNKLYNYQISTSTLLSILDLEYSDIGDNPNIIKVVLNREKEISKIDMEFTPYFKYKGLCDEKLNISMEYSNYLKVGKIFM